MQPLATHGQQRSLGHIQPALLASTLLSLVDASQGLNSTGSLLEVSAGLLVDAVCRVQLQDHRKGHHSMEQMGQMENKGYHPQPQNGTSKIKLQCTDCSVEQMYLQV